MVKDIVEPMFASMLPGPLATLHFAKIDLGHVPMRISKVDTHRTETQGIKLDMDVEWDGKCDIELDGKMIPKLVGAHVSPMISLATVSLTRNNRASSTLSSWADFPSSCRP